MVRSSTDTVRPLALTVFYDGYVGSAFSPHTHTRTMKLVVYQARTVETVRFGEEFFFTALLEVSLNCRKMYSRANRPRDAAAVHRFTDQEHRLGERH